MGGKECIGGAAQSVGPGFGGLAPDRVHKKCAKTAKRLKFEHIGIKVAGPSGRGNVRESL